MTEALFTRHGDAFVPSAATSGPWDPGALHGGAVGALLARAVEAVEAPGPMFVSRMTVELLRPVPMVPLTVTTELARPGKKVQLVDARIAANGVEVVRATALRIREQEIELPEYPGPDGQPPPMPAEAFEWPDARAGFIHAMEVRLSEGHFLTPGPASVWFRLKVPVVDGEAPSRLSRVMAAADFGNGISGVLDFSRFVYINPDLTVYLGRLPRGEWVCLEAVTDAEPNGVGFAASRLWDESGQIGRASQALLLEQRPKT
jgi:Thioesterase-like superfamily